MPYLFKLSKRVARTRSRALILAAAAAFACEPTDPMNGPAHPSYATIDGRPTPVADLTVSAVTDTSVTLSFTEVDDGAGNPASYDVRYALTPISWGPPQSAARGSRALEVHFLVGGKTPTWGGAARHLFKETESVYLSYWVKYSANWVGSGRSYHPHEFLFLTNENDVYSGLSFTHLTAYVEHNYQNGGIPALQLQDGANVDQTKIGVDLSSVTESRAAAG